MSRKGFPKTARRERACDYATGRRRRKRRRITPRSRPRGTPIESDAAGAETANASWRGRYRAIALFSSARGSMKKPRPKGIPWGRDDTTLLSRPACRQAGTLGGLTAASPSEPTVRPLRTWVQQLRGEFRLPTPPGSHLTSPALCGRGRTVLLPFTAFRYDGIEQYIDEAPRLSTKRRFVSDSRCREDPAWR